MSMKIKRDAASRPASKGLKGVEPSRLQNSRYRGMMMAALGSIGWRSSGRTAFSHKFESSKPVCHNAAGSNGKNGRDDHFKGIDKNVVKVYWPLPFHPFRYASRL